MPIRPPNGPVGSASPLFRPRTREEIRKTNKLKQEKPHVFDKMKMFDHLLYLGQSIAIIRLEYNYMCNLRCGHCSIHKFQGVTDRRVLTPEDVADLSIQADELGLARFVVTGGEPLLFPDLDEIVEAIHPERHYINLDTNGWFLNLPKAKHLKSIGVDRIQLSIDSLIAADHDAFRGKVGSHIRAMRALEASQEADLDVFVQTVVDNKRLYSDEFREFIRFFNSLDVGVFVTFLKPVGAQSDRSGMVTREDMGHLDKMQKEGLNVFWHVTKAYGRDLGCIAVKAMVSITAFGDVNPCPYIFKPIGNIFDEPLKDILARGMKTPPFDRYIDTCPIADAEWNWDE